MLSTHRDIKVKEGAAGRDAGHLCVAVEPSSLQHVRTKLSITHLSCSMKGVRCVHVCTCVCVCACVHPCAHVAFVCFFVHVHALPFLLDGTIKVNDRVQSIVPGLCSCSIIVTTVRSLLSNAEDYLCLYAKSQLKYSKEMLQKF